MKFSVIIPIYKVEQYLRQCIDSVLAQTYTDFEIILVDDGSPDGCPAICDEYADKDSRIKVIHKPNGGLSDARNAGLDAAKGEYVIFLDSDDYYRNNDFLESIAAATDGGSKDAVFFQRTVFFDGIDRPDMHLPSYNLEWNKLSTGELLLQLAAHDRMDASACMKASKRQILQQNELYFRKGMFCEDIEWFSRYILYINSVALVNKPDYYYRKRAGSITATLKEKNVRDLFYTIQTHTNRIRNLAIDINKKRAILSYHAYQFCIVLGLTSNILTGIARRTVLKECGSYKWLCDYAYSPKTKKSSALVKFLGVNIASRVLGYYIKNKYQ